MQIDRLRILVSTKKAIQPVWFLASDELIQEITALFFSHVFLVKQTISLIACGKEFRYVTTAD